MSDKQKDLTTHLHAFALGCLDNEDFIKVLNHIRAAEEFPYQELGEYQNLASLLPSFLEIEMPDQSVKDKVARKLYRLKEQKRPERTTRIMSPSEPEEPKQNEYVEEEIPVENDPFSGHIDEDKIRAELLDYSKQEPEEEEVGTFDAYIPDSQPEEEIIPEPEVIPEPEIIEEVEEEPTFKPVTPFSRRSPELNRPKQETQVSSREKQDIPERDKYEEEQNKFSFPKSETENIDPYQFFTSEEKASIDVTSESAIPSFDQKIENKEDSYLSSYTTDSYSSENNYNSDYKTPSQEQYNSSRFQSVNPSLAATPEKIIEEKIVEKIVYEPSKSVSPALFIFFVLLLGAGIGSVYYFLNKEIKILSNSNAEQFEKLITANQTSIDYKPLLELIEAKSTQTITLTSADKNSISFARLFYNPKTEKGLIKIDNLEVLDSEQVYNLWVSVYRSVTPLGTVKYNGVNEFYPVQNFPDIFSLKEATFFITIEPVSGSQNPTSTPILLGIYKN
jgi:hypothetical protein